MKFWFVFFMAIMAGVEEKSMKNIPVEEISITQNRHLNEFEEPTESSSNIRKKKWGNPDPNAEVVALSPAELQDSRKFTCEICNFSCSRIQNLQFYYTAHNLHYKLPKKDVTQVTRKKVYICPDVNCIHHNPTRALSDLGTIKKHYNRKHKEKSLRCDKCLQKYALKADLNAHQKKCSTRKYERNLDGSKYSRIDRFEIDKVQCQSQGPTPNEVLQISMKKVYEVEDVSVPKNVIQFGPLNSSPINHIAQNLEKCKGFETPEFNGPKKLPSRNQMLDSTQQHSVHADSYEEKSIWDLTYSDLF